MSHFSPNTNTVGLQRTEQRPPVEVRYAYTRPRPPGLAIYRREIAGRPLLQTSTATGAGARHPQTTAFVFCLVFHFLLFFCLPSSFFLLKSGSELLIYFWSILINKSFSSDHTFLFYSFSTFSFSSLFFFPFLWKRDF